MPLLREYGDVADVRPYGGTILHMFFHRILHNFDESNPLHVALIEMACNAEEFLVRSGALPSDFGAVAARKRQ